MKYILLLLLLILAGCDKSKTDGKLRHKLFVECMELAAKMPRQSDDDVSDIILQCSNTSYNIHNHMMNSKSQ